MRYAAEEIMDLAANRVIPKSKPCVLVADDQADVQEALRLLLKGAGYDAETVGSPRALLDAIRRRQFDLVLLDMNYTRDTTSGEEGLDLLARVREMSLTPVVVMTAWSDVELAVEAMRRGAADFVQKPWDNTRLLRTVSKHSQNAGQIVSRMQTDMEVAHRIQQKLLPPDEGKVGMLEYAARCIPALNVGGDYYDVLKLDDDHTAFLLADVSGKGTAAALLMANLQGCVRTQAPVASHSAAALLKSVNRQFVEASGPEHFVTLFFGVFQNSRRELTYVNCGHHAPLLVSANGTCSRLEPTATVLGMFSRWDCAEEHCTLAPGDTLLLFSDGVLECGEDDGDVLGIDTLISLAVGMQNGRLKALPDRIVDTVNALSGAVPHDDVSVLALRPM